MAESTDRRVRKTPEEKLSELQSKNRMGMDEIALQLGCRLPHLKLTAKVGREILDTFLELVKESLKGGRNVVFPGFGSFVVKERKALFSRAFRRLDQIWCWLRRARSEARGFRLVVGAERHARSLKRMRMQLLIR